MHNYLVDTELARLAVVLGIIVGLLIYERLGITMGGIIVPGYLALFVPQPAYIVVTLLLAISTYYVVHHVILKRYILYGRIIFELEILVGLSLQAIWTIILVLISQTGIDLMFLLGIGFVLPGIIAHDINRQGIKSTIPSALIGSFAVFLIIVLIDLFRDLLPTFISATPSPLLRSQPYLYAYPRDLFLLAVIISVIGGVVFYHRYDLRTGGFVVPAYLALFALRPLDLLFVLICAALTYLLVTQLAMRTAIIFGRTKMGLMVLVGFVIAWWAEMLTLSLTGGRYVPWSGFAVIMPMIVALLANDAERQGPLRTLAGSVLGSAWVLLIIYILILSWNFVQPL